MPSNVIQFEKVSFAFETMSERRFQPVLVLTFEYCNEEFTTSK